MPQHYDTPFFNPRNVAPPSADTPLRGIDPNIGASLRTLAEPTQPVPIPPSNPEEKAVLKGKWMEFLGNPEVKQGLLQFAVNAMQPIPTGQSLQGHLTRAVAGGGEAIARRRGEVGERADIEAARALEERRVGALEFQVDVQREGVQSRERIESAARRQNVLLAQATRQFTSTQNALERAAAGTNLDRRLEGSMEVAMMQISAQERIARDSNEWRLMSDAVNQRYATYRQELESYLPGGVVPVAPTAAGLRIDYLIQKATVLQEPVESGVISLSEEQMLADRLTGPNQLDRAGASILVGLMSDEAAARIMDLVDAAAPLPPPAVLPGPAAVGTPATVTDQAAAGAADERARNAGELGASPPPATTVKTTPRGENVELDSMFEGEHVGIFSSEAHLHGYSLNFLARVGRKIKEGTLGKHEFWKWLQSRKADASVSQEVLNRAMDFATIGQN